MFYFAVLHIRMKKLGSMSLQSDYLQFFMFVQNSPKRKLMLLLYPRVIIVW